MLRTIGWILIVLAMLMLYACITLTFWPESAFNDWDPKKNHIPWYGLLASFLLLCVLPAVAGSLLLLLVPKAPPSKENDGSIFPRL